MSGKVELKGKKCYCGKIFEPKHCAHLYCSQRCKWRKAYYKYKEHKQSKRRLAYKRNPLKVKARAALGYAVKAGKIVKTPCVICGKKKVQAHHEDYTKPLEVIWLCKNHHHLLHRNLKEV